MQREAREKRLRAARRKELNIQFAWGVGVLIVIFFMGGLFMLVVQSRQKMYPQYGDGFFPTTERQRYEESQPQVYVGR